MMPAPGARGNLEPGIRLIDVAKRFGHTDAVRGVSLDVARGELLTLLGPSGSGKSTTLMMVAGHETPDAGAILIGGTDVTYLPAYRRDIGMVFQHYALFPHLTVAQNIAFPLRMRRISRAESARRVQGALDLVRMRGLGERYPRQLSGGQQQRVALARALVFDPSILLMDEPLSSLDKKLREEMQLEIRRVQQELGITTIYVTHDQREALTLSDRVAVLDRGAVAQVGTPAELYDCPRSRFVADFIGESNFLTGRVVERAVGLCAVLTAHGLLVRGRAPEDVAPGDEVLVLVRPESILLGEPPGEGEINRTTGVVEEVTYYGEATRVGLRIGDAQSLVVKQSSSGLQGAVSRGDKAPVYWTWSKTTILAEGGPR
jgi:spermidine/putrescine ABC transporter ATP-binding subunit